MDLFSQSLLDTKRNTTPETFSRHLRAAGPVYRWERGGFWIVTDHALATQVLQRPDFSADRGEFFISRMPDLDLNLIPDFFGVVRRMMVMSDAPRHAARRHAAVASLTEPLLARLRATIQRVVPTLVTFDHGRLDFTRAVAEILPFAVLAELFMIPDAHREEFYDCSFGMTQFFGGASEYRNEDGIAVNRRAVRLREYFSGEIQKRRAAPTGDFLSHLVGIERDLDLFHDELVAQCVMMLVAGMVTTTDQLCNNLYTLLTIPGLWATLRTERTRLAGAIEECHRWDPAVTFLFRVVRQPTRLGGVDLPKGAVIFVAAHAVNRDPAVFADPDTFRSDRSPNPHVAFGSGPHYCMGARLGRLQMTAIFDTLLDRVPGLRLDPESTARKHTSLAFSGFDRLTLVHEEGPYAAAERTECVAAL